MQATAESNKGLFERLESTLWHLLLLVLHPLISALFIYFQARYLINTMNTMLVATQFSSEDFEKRFTQDVNSQLQKALTTGINPYKEVHVLLIS